MQAPPQNQWRGPAPGTQIVQATAPVQVAPPMQVAPQVQVAVPPPPPPLPPPPHQEGIVRAKLPDSQPIRDFDSVAIKKLEKRMNIAMTTVLSCAELLGKDAVVKILQKNASGVYDVMSNRLHLCVAENVPNTTQHESAKADLHETTAKKKTRLKQSYLREYVILLKRRYGTPPDGEPVGRITNMSSKGIDRILMRYYNEGFLLDPYVVEYLTKAAGDNSEPLVDDTNYDETRRICWDPKKTIVEIKRYVEGREDKRANPANLVDRIRNLSGYVPRPKSNKPQKEKAAKSANKSAAKKKPVPGAPPMAGMSMPMPMPGNSVVPQAGPSDSIIVQISDDNKGAPKKRRI